MNILYNILRVPRIIKQIIVLLVDIISSLSALIITVFLLKIKLVLDFNFSFIVVFISIFSFIPFSIYLGLYRSIFRFSGLYSITQIFITCFIHSIIFYIIINFSKQSFLQPSLALTILQPLILFFFMASTRTLIVIIYTLSQNLDKKPKAVIYGAGSIGYKFYKQYNDKYSFICYLDDNDKLDGKKIDNIKIINSKRIINIIENYNIDYLFVCFPEINLKIKNQIIEQISPYNVGLKFITSILIDKKNNKSLLKDINSVDMNNIVTREIEWNENSIKRLISGKTVLVTGAGGSIGSELCRQLIRYDPKNIIAIDNSEYNLYEINFELSNLIKSNNIGLNFQTILANMENLEFLEFLFSKYKINIIFHTAAYKHVPLLENNVFSAVKNNIFNTVNLVEIASKYNVNNFTFISTDKAVRPTNIMGSTKRFSEIYLQSLSEKLSGKMIITIVRFGNVFASRGSAVPLFISQVKNGGPVTITDKIITRYFMSISEAVGLVLESSHISLGGEVFVLNMGDPIKIYYLIKKIIQLSGFTEKTIEKPYGDIEVKSIGLRPGEKLHEELLIGNDPISTMNQNIFKANENFIKFPEFLKELILLKESYSDNNINKCIKILKNNTYLNTNVSR